MDALEESRTYRLGIGRLEVQEGPQTIGPGDLKVSVQEVKEMSGLLAKQVRTAVKGLDQG